MDFYILHEITKVKHLAKIILYWNFIKFLGIVTGQSLSIDWKCFGVRKTKTYRGDVVAVDPLPNQEL